MVKSETDVDALLATARNASTSGCKIIAALDKLDAATADKLRAALMERKAANGKQWEYVAERLAAVFRQLVPGCDVTQSTIENYRGRQRG